MDPFTAMAGASLISGALGYLGSSKNADAQMANAQANIAYQKEFAQNGVQWKVADAKKAGLHPLAALGANTMSFSPVSIGNQDTLSNAGQSIERAVRAGLDAQSIMMDNEVKKAQTRLLNAQAKNVEGQGNAGNDQTASNPLQPVTKQPEIVASGMTFNQAVEAGVHPAYSQLRTADGGIMLVKSEKATEATEEDFLASINLAIDQYGLPWFEANFKPSLNDILPSFRKKGHNDWKWDGRKFVSFKNKGQMMPSHDVYKSKYIGTKKFGIYTRDYSKPIR